MTTVSESYHDSLQRLTLLANRVNGPIRRTGRMQLNCDRHGPYIADGTYLTTRVVWSSCPACVEDMHRRESEQKAEIARIAYRNKIAGQIEQAAVPARFIGRTLDSFRAESPDQQKALAVSRDFVANWKDAQKKGPWLVFAGKPGTGKSHLAIAILQALMPNDVGRYMTCMELFQKIRSTWRKDSDASEHDVIAALSSVPLLVLDEIGVQNGTDSEILHLFDVLDKRYRDMMPTILLTNQNKEGFRQFVGDRIYDRMTECAKWVPFAWESYRPQARKEMADA